MQCSAPVSLSGCIEPICYCTHASCLSLGFRCVMLVPMHSASAAWSPPIVHVRCAPGCCRHAVTFLQVGDTGLDMSSCFFSDVNYRRYGSLLTGRPQRIELPDHRKVVQYYVAEGAPS